MEITQYIVDAFTNRVFRGNPAAVCLLDEWLPDSVMKDIARENAISETAFVVAEKNGHYALRWFTPKVEIDLCGHATLASAFVIDRFVRPGLETIHFDTKSGELTVRKHGLTYLMSLPSYELRPMEVVPFIEEAIGIRPSEAYMGRDMVCVVESAELVRALTPNLKKVLTLDGLMLHVTVKGEERFDCVSRTFAPKCGVPEDPVCGSGHCHLVPYWSERLGNAEVTALQASARGGILHCRMQGKNVLIGGEAVLFAKSTLFINLQNGISK